MLPIQTEPSIHTYYHSHSEGYSHSNSGTCTATVTDFYDKSQNKFVTSILCVSCNCFLPHPQWESSTLLLYYSDKLKFPPLPWSTSQDWLHSSTSKRVASDVFFTLTKIKFHDTPLKCHQVHWLLPYTVKLVRCMRCDKHLHEYFTYQPPQSLHQPPQPTMHCTLLQNCSTTNTANSTKHYSVTYVSKYLNLHMPKGWFSTFRDVLHEESTKWSLQCVLESTSLSSTKLPDITESPQPKEHFSDKFSASWSSGAPALGQTRSDLKIIQTTPYLTNQDSDRHSDACKPSNLNTA